MIKIKRISEPEFLRSRKVEKEQEKLKTRYNNTNIQSRVAFNMSILQEVKPILLEMSMNKCNYCESIVGVVSHGHIDNFRPKSGARGLTGEYHKDHYWWLTYSWGNLLLSCEVCNKKKRNYFPLENEKDRAKVNTAGEQLQNEKPLLLNPYIDEPSDHFKFLSNGRLSSLTEKGEVTIKLIGLNRPELVARRKQAISRFKSKLTQLELLSNENLDSFIRESIDDIKILLSDQPYQEYAGALRSVFNKWLPENLNLWEKFEKSIPRESIKKEKNISEVERRKVSKVRATYKRLKRFSIESIEIRNFKSIEHLKLNLNQTQSKDENLLESWLLILGDNGIGKSSILQAISLCLIGQKAIQSLQLDVLDYLKRGEQSGSVKIRGNENQTILSLTYDENGFKTGKVNPACFTLGYGSTRLLPKGNIQPYPNKERFVNIKNLFDYSYSLEDPNSWLNTISQEEFESRVAPALIDLLLLDGEDKLTFKKGKIHIMHLGEEHLLEHMSDGYRSIAGLALDIMNTLSIDQAGFHHATGIVLIDEIGSHLHPRWKVKIVRALKKTFPNLQFIVTSHEPLCLRGIDKGEVGVLTRDNNRKVKILDASVLKDHTVMSLEQLLTSDLFGLLDVYDEDVVKTYEEYYELLSKPSKTEEEEERILQLSKDLPNQTLLLGATQSQQIHYELLHKEYVSKLKEEGYRTAEELKKETKEQAKTLINKQNLDWL